MQTNQQQHIVRRDTTIGKISCEVFAEVLCLHYIHQSRAQTGILVCTCTNA